MSASLTRRREEVSEVSRWVCFELEGQMYGLPILKVQEVLEGASIEPVPGTADQVLGVINLRGNVVTVLDLRRCLGLTPEPQALPHRIVIVDHDDEAIGLKVDRIADVRKVALAAIKPTPETGAGTHKGRVHGVVSRKGEILTLLDVEALLRQSPFVA